MESTDYSPASTESHEQSTPAETHQDWGQQNGVHLTESGLPSMAYDMPSAPAPDQVTEPVSAPEPTTETATSESAWAPAAERRTGTTARARECAQQMAATIVELGHTLDEYEAERAQSAQERESLQERIRELRQHQITKDRFVDTVRRGSAGSVSDEDLETIRGMMEALSQDPDRLTVLFTVVQQASKLAAVVNDYVDLRHMA